MKFTFWGTRGSIPVPGKETTTYGGNTTCLEIVLESGRQIIVDAGTGIRALGEKLTNEDRLDLHLLITHIHWDHILGFPFFDPIYREFSKIAIDGFHTCMKGLRIPFDNKMVDCLFPVRFEALKAQIEYLQTVEHGPLRIGGAKVESIPLQHPQGGLGYRFREGDRMLVFLTDNELTQEAWAGRHPDDYVRFCEGADVLIHDAQFTPEEHLERTGWGHSDYEGALELATRAGVGKLILFHHDPPRKDSELDILRDRCESLAKERKSRIVVELATEGVSATLE
jgi:phosphoribosyl 1,2-cyclic phosphodiesterase